METKDDSNEESTCPRPMQEMTPEEIERLEEVEFTKGPLSVLMTSMKNRTQVLVNCRNNHKFLGLVKAFDRHINILLADVREMWTEKVRANVGDTKKSVVNKDRYISKMFMRGDNVILIVKVPSLQRLPKLHDLHISQLDRTPECDEIQQQVLQPQHGYQEGWAQPSSCQPGGSQAPRYEQGARQNTANPQSSGGDQTYQQTATDTQLPVTYQQPTPEIHTKQQQEQLYPKPAQEVQLCRDSVHVMEINQQFSKGEDTCQTVVQESPGNQEEQMQIELSPSTPEAH